jgi:aryl-alcohol dehydrogenase-like predicted oxidoreductase
MTAGRYNRPADQDVIDTVRRLAEARGESPAQVAIAWLLSKPGVTAPIIGATRLAQLDAPLAAVDAALSADEIGLLEAPYVAQAVSGLAMPGDLPAGAPRKRT